jgi:molybdate/tungstate transport system substrate-binding protein
MRAALDTFAAREHVRVEQQNTGSLEAARMLIELHKIPDVIALADYQVFANLLMPKYVSWYADFAHNRMVLAYTGKSRFASEITTQNWWQVLQRPGVQVGRSDPNLDPNGYRTLIVMQLAERYYKQPGLYNRLLAAAPPRNVRPKEVDLVGILQAGELDYIWSYESLAQAASLSYVQLAPEIDLGNLADTASYAQAVVRVAGRTPRDTLSFEGQPIVYALSIPTGAPHAARAAKFVAFLLSADGKRVLRTARLDALEQPVLVGTDIPAAVSAVVRGP